MLLLAKGTVDGEEDEARPFSANRRLPTLGIRLTTMPDLQRQGVGSC